MNYLSTGDHRLVLNHRANEWKLFEDGNDITEEARLNVTVTAFSAVESRPVAITVMTGVGSVPSLPKSFVLTTSLKPAGGVDCEGCGDSQYQHWQVKELKE